MNLQFHRNKFGCSVSLTFLDFLHELKMKILIKYMRTMKI